MEPTEQEITAFVDALGAGAGEGAGLGEAFSAAYSELCGLAHAQRRHWSGLETLSTTALVHEAYLKLAQQDALVWRDRAHFFRIAARAMRFILINYAEHRRTAKRGGMRVHVPADEVPLVEDSQIEDVLALDEALHRLARQNPRWARVVECRVFAGLEVDETAEALEISARTVKRDWQRAQTWLYRELGGASDERRATDP